MERASGSSPAIDPAVLAELRQFQGEGEPDILLELAEAFQSETPPLLEALHVAVREEQPEVLKRAAHNLKGSSYNMGARAMAELCSELESLASKERSRGRQTDYATGARISSRLPGLYSRGCRDSQIKRVYREE